MYWLIPVHLHHTNNVESKLMNTRNFFELLKARHEQGLRICVGLDPDVAKIPNHIRSNYAGKWQRQIYELCRHIVDATKEHVCAFKPNSAFFEGIVDGSQILADVIAYINAEAPEVPCILDFKRGDIGSTNIGYKDSAFAINCADAITVNPYMGKVSLQPFLDEENKGIFILCRTSNPGAAEFQNLIVQSIDGPVYLYEYVAKQVVTTWNVNNNCCLVVGATAPEELTSVRGIIGPDMTILIPGIGAQGGDIEKTVRAGGPNIIVNLSRSVLYASDGDDFAKAARQEVERVNAER